MNDRSLFFFCICFVLNFGTSFGEVSIQHITNKDDLDKFKDAKNAFLLHKADFCMFSSAMYKNLEQAAKLVNSSIESNVKVGVITCSPETKHLCSHTPYFPFTLLYNKKELFAQYTSSRTEESLKELLEDLAEGTIKNVANSSLAQLPHFMNHINSFLVVKVQNKDSSVLLKDVKAIVDEFPENFFKVYVVEENEISTEDLILHLRQGSGPESTFREHKIETASSRKIKQQLLDLHFIRDIISQGALRELIEPKKNTMLLFYSQDDPYSVDILNRLNKAYKQGQFNDILMQTNIYSSELNTFVKSSFIGFSMKIDSMVPIVVCSTLDNHLGFLPIDLNNNNITQSDTVLIQEFKKAVKSMIADSHSMYNSQNKHTTINERKGINVLADVKEQILKDSLESVKETFDIKNKKYITDNMDL